MSHNFAVRENGRLRAIVGLFPMEIQAGETLLKLGGSAGFPPTRTTEEKAG